MSNWSIDIAPMVPAPLFWGGVILAVAMVALLLVRRSRGALLRALSLAALLAALANPTLRQEERESLANIAIVVLDESLSQSIAGRPEQAQAIKSDLETRLGGINNLQVRWVSSSRPTGEAASGTHLFTDLNARARQHATRPAGRRDHDHRRPGARRAEVAACAGLRRAGARAADRQARRVRPPHRDHQGAALRHRRRKEGKLRASAGPRAAGGERNIQFRVVEEGRRPQPGDSVQVRIRREGRSDELRRVQIGRIVTAEMDFPHAGQNIVEIEAEGAPGELTLVNNRAVIVAEGVRENLRVLLVSGEPHAGERTWRNLLRSDAAVDLVHFTILRPPQKQDGTPIHQLSLIAFPTRELFSEKINCFDLIIFDRYQHRDILQLLYYENIARYVEQGGALLVAAGDDFSGAMSLSRTPLSVVLPATPTGRVLEQPFKAKLSGDGNKHPVTRGLPGSDADPAKDPAWGRWFRQVDVVPSRGRVVMNGAENRPLLLLDRKDRGRVALLLSDHAWLWARGFEGGGPHTDLLRRLAHWLMKEPDLEEERLLASARGLKLTIERRSMEESVPVVQLSAPGGETDRGDARQGRPRIVAQHDRCAFARPLQDAEPVALRPAHRGRPRRHRGRARDERGDGHRGQDEAAGGCHRRRRVLDARQRPAGERQFGRRAAHLHAGQCARAGGLRLARPQGSRGLRDTRRQADPDVQRPAGAGGPAGPAGGHLVARGAVVFRLLHASRRPASGSHPGIRGSSGRDPEPRGKSKCPGSRHVSCAQAGMTGIVAYGADDLPFNQCLGPGQFPFLARLRAAPG